MLTLPVTVFLAAAVGVGLYLFTLRRRGIRRSGLVTLHFLLGAAGLLQLVMLQRGTPSGDVVNAGRFGSLAAELFALSIISGALAPILARRGSANTLLNIHVTIGLGGFVMFLAWLSAL